jgi:oxalate decarboxylase/phosphoglucose isomerase-like protein (cupin superfamily)
VLLFCLLTACSAVSPTGPLRANLGAGAAGDAAFAKIAAAFTSANPGHSLAFAGAARQLPPGSMARVALVQSGAATAQVERAAGAPRTSQVGIGDLVVLDPGEWARFSEPVDLLVFGLPTSPDAGLPRVIRPDWDPGITDTPGGCATDGKAYRRVLLTWRGENGPYTFHGLNVHRVRIDDSFTHYHPRVGGFDEFYLVQAVREGAHLLTSVHTDEIEHPEAIRREDVPALFESMQLQQGDLVYLPRGLAHRGLGGVLAQVITVPGFVPGAEIGLDHHLHAINVRLGLTGDEALPVHAAGALRPIVR